MNSARAFPIALVLLACSTVAAAQGKGAGHGHGNGNGRITGPSAAGAPELQLAGTGIRNFGSWLDDASVLPNGDGSLALSFGYWRTPGYHEFDIPVIDGGLGVSRRVQFGFSVPYYHANEPGGPVARGLGDIYLNTKVQLRDPGDRQIGFAVIPIVELLSNAPAPGEPRVNWAIPGSVEFRVGNWRAYGTAGYFSRGAIFASGAVEVALSNRAWMTGSISRSHSIDRDDVSGSMGLSQSRTDVSGGGTIALTPAVYVFATIGRTISRRDANSATVMLTTGLAFSFNAWRAPAMSR
jgi:hypothetical protein